MGPSFQTPRSGLGKLASRVAVALTATTVTGATGTVARGVYRSRRRRRSSTAPPAMTSNAPNPTSGPARKPVPASEPPPPDGTGTGAPLVMVVVGVPVVVVVVVLVVRVVVVVVVVVVGLGGLGPAQSPVTWPMSIVSSCPSESFPPDPAK